MPRVRKVPIVYGPKRIIHTSEGPEIARTKFCGECEKVLQAVTIQIGKATADREDIPRIIKIGDACRNSDKHKDGKSYIWPSEDWILPRR